MYKEQFEQVKTYFGEKGITATSANYLANLSKEYASKLHSELQDLSFTDKSIQIIGAASQSPLLMEKGSDEQQIADIPSKIQLIGKLNAFNAWMRSAIKAKESLVASVKGYDLDDYVTEFDKTLPNGPSRVVEKSADDIIGSWNVKERNNYLALEAQAAALGKYIHEDGSISVARKNLHKALAKPRIKEGSGQDITITTSVASVDPNVIEDVFMKLQAEHRSVEQRLNSLKSQIKKAISEDYVRRSNEAIAKKAAFNAAHATLIEEYNIFREKRLSEIQALKIVVPEAHQEIYDFLNSLGQGSKS